MVTKLVTHERYLIVLSLLYLILSYSTLFLDRGTFYLITAEDSYFETTGALCFFVTAVLFIIAYFRSSNAKNRKAHTPVKKLSYLVLALLFLFGAGEEISWGQRIFHIETPEAISAINVQHEITLHNLKVFQGGERNLLTIDGPRLFSFFWLAFTLVVPVASAAYKPAQRWFKRFMPVIPWFFGMLFVANYTISKVAVLLFTSDTHHGIMELKEHNFAVLFGVIAFYIVRVMLKSTSVNSSCKQ